MRIVVWGTYESARPRTRIMLRGLRDNGVEIVECHTEVWAGIEDKTQIRGLGPKAQILLRWLWSYPALIVRYLLLPEHDLVLVGYMGHLDIVVIWPFARLRRKKVAWDMFLSLYDAAIDDRKLFNSSHFVAKALYVWEWIATRLADLILLDTSTHASFIERRYSASRGKTSYMFVGVEPEKFPPKARPVMPDGGFNDIIVLFYGQFIPGHGIDTIIEAAKQARSLKIRWILAGTGQEEDRIQRLLAEYELENVLRLRWIPYLELVDWIHRSHVCLGHFGVSDKVSRVIPNKVFEILHAGAPLITRDSPAIRELIEPEQPEIQLVRPGDPSSLLAAVLVIIENSNDFSGRILHQEIAQRITPAAIGSSLMETLDRIAEG